jgi:hypothetical protein
VVASTRRIGSDRPPAFLYDFLMNSLLPSYGALNLIEVARKMPPERPGMIYFLLTLLALAVAFMLWFLAALIRESRQLRPRTGATHEPEGGRPADVEN